MAPVLTSSIVLLTLGFWGIQMQLGYMDADVVVRSSEQ
jgi:hypothetical protein